MKEMSSLILAITIFFLLIPASPSSSSSSSSYLGGFKLVFQWPNTFCLNRYCHHPIPQYFTVHGLWPCNRYFEPLQHQSGQIDLEEEDVSEIEDDLDIMMPNLLAPPAENFDFWSEQWEKHGKTSELEPEDYFANIVSSTREIERLLGGNLADFFAEQDVGLSIGNTHPAEKFGRKIRRQTGYVTQIACDRDDNLDEVYFCLTYDLSLTDCPNRNPSCNGRHIYFPAGYNPHEEF